MSNTTVEAILLLLSLISLEVYFCNIFCFELSRSSASSVYPVSDDCFALAPRGNGNGTLTIWYRCENRVKGLMKQPLRIFLFFFF